MFIEFFNDEKVQLIESYPKGDSYLIIWQKILALASKQKSGELSINGTPYTVDMLSIVFRKPIELIKETLRVLHQLGLIGYQNKTIFITEWKHYKKQNDADAVREEYREQTRRRVAKYRESHKSAPKKPKKPNTVTDDTNYMPIYKEIIDYLNQKAGTRYRHTSKIAREHIHARLAEGYTVDDFKKVIDKKCKEWLNSDFSPYLRPETLFSSKFEAYLNAPAKITEHEKRFGFEGHDYSKYEFNSLFDD